MISAVERTMLSENECLTKRLKECERDHEVFANLVNTRVLDLQKHNTMLKSELDRIKNNSSDSI